MTLEEKILAFGNKKKAEEEKAEIERQAELESLLQKISTYQDRVDRLLKLGKMCKENGIKFISRSSSSSCRKETDDMLISDGIYHRLGFNREFTAIGFYNGGYDGEVDTFVYGTSENRSIEYNHHHNYDSLHLKKWLNNFGAFESQFERYINSL